MTDRRGTWRGARRGQMAVIFALTLAVLMGAMALGIDLSRLRTQAEDEQRVANAAALAGVVFLPDFFSSASSRAIGEAAKNGITNGVNGAVVDPEIANGNPNQLKVTISEPATSIFGNVLGFSPGTIRRSATAEFAEPLEMGAPDYVLGYAPFPTNLVSGASATQGFYLEIRGPYGQQENGDAYSQYFESFNSKGLSSTGTQTNLTNPCTANPTYCTDPPSSSSPLTPNPDRNYYHVDGYDFVIDKATDASHPLVIKLFDPYDESPMQFDSTVANKPGNQAIATPYNTEFIDQAGCYAGNTHFCPGGTSSASLGYPVALQFTLNGPYQTTFDTTPKPVAAYTGAAGGTCSGECVLSNAAAGLPASFTAGDDPTYEACRAANNCGSSSVKSPYAFRFLNYAIVHQPGLYRIHVKSVINPTGLYAGTYGTGGNNFAIAACADTSPVLGSSADPSAGGAATASPVQDSTHLWNQASCGDPNTSAAGADSSCATPATAPAGTCTHVYALNRMCIYNNLSGNGSTALVPLGYVPTVYAGKKLHISLYDVGDVSNSSTTSVQVLTPAGDNTHTAGNVGSGTGYPTSTEFWWWVAPFDTANSGYPSVASQASPNHGAAGTVIGSLGSNTGNYNGRWLYIDTYIPDSSVYDPMVTNYGGYWKMRYNIPAGGSGNDTTTWEISVTGSPVHLVG